VSGFPRFGACANTKVDPRASATPMNLEIQKCRVMQFPLVPFSRVYMLHLAVPVDRPARDRVVMFVRKCGYGRRACGLVAHRHELGSSRLRVTGLVPRTALQDCRTAVPPPRYTKSCKRLAQHRLLQRRLCPGLAAVG